MNESTIVEQFFAEECSAYVRDLLLDAIDRRGDGGPSLRHFEFNRFEVSIDRDTQMVLLEDVLDITPTGTQRVALDEFADGLRGMVPRV